MPRKNLMRQPWEKQWTGMLSRKTLHAEPFSALPAADCSLRPPIGVDVVDGDCFLDIKQLVASPQQTSTIKRSPKRRIRELQSRSTFAAIPRRPLPTGKHR